MSNHASEPRGFQFPGVFDISAMGAADAGLERLVPELLVAAGLRVIEDSLRTRPSRAGNYLSVTVSFQAEHREHYECAHAALRACAGVKWTL